MDSTKKRHEALSIAISPPQSSPFTESFKISLPDHDGHVDLSRSTLKPRSPLHRQATPEAPSLKLRTAAAEEIASLEAKIEDAKTTLDGQLFLLRTQVSRIEEIERLVELGSHQLMMSRRRRDIEITELETQRRHLQQQLDKQLAENALAAERLAATQAKNDGMNKRIRAQVVTLAESFSPRWAAQDIRDHIHATVAPGGGAYSPEEEADAIRAVLDLRTREERMVDVTEWKRMKDAEARAQEMKRAADAQLALQQALEDQRAEEFAKRIETLRHGHINHTHETKQAATAEPESDAVQRPHIPHSPALRLHDRYITSAKRSVTANANIL